LLKRFEGNPDVEKAKLDFDRAQEVEERFHKDFDGQDFTMRQAALRFEVQDRSICELHLDGSGASSLRLHVQVNNARF
jgi:hypothetical protein